jgi:hypothetical protein
LLKVKEIILRSQILFPILETTTSNSTQECLIPFKNKHLTFILAFIKFSEIGQVAEWSKALVLKTSVGQPTVGSNPTLPAKMNDYPN